MGVRRSRLLCMILVPAMLVTLMFGVTMTARADSLKLTVEDVGHVICTDGSVYTNVLEAENFGKTPAAMIAYIDPINNKGIAIGLKEIDELHTLSEWQAGDNHLIRYFNPNISALSPYGAEWHIPSLEEWQLILVGCGASGTPGDTGNIHNWQGLKEKLSNAGGNILGKAYYYSSTKNNTFVKLLKFNYGYYDKYSAVVEGGSIYQKHGVRPCFSFSVYSDAVKDWRTWDSGDCKVTLRTDKQLIITKKDGSTGGNMADYGGGNVAPWADYKDYITSVVVEDGVTNIGNSAFYSMPELTKCTLSDSVKSIGNAAFGLCNKLDTLEGGTEIKTIGDFAFAGTGLKEFGFYNSELVSIGNNAFVGSKLTQLMLHDTVQTIGDYAFSQNPLTEVYNNSLVPQSINDSVFYGVNKGDCTLYVLKESLEAYKNAKVWEDFGNITVFEKGSDEDVTPSQDSNNSNGTSSNSANSADKGTKKVSSAAKTGDDAPIVIGLLLAKMSHYVV